MTTGQSVRPTRTAFRTCPLCEAGCGLEITVGRDADGAEHVTRIRGDRDDVFSKGFICPKGSTLRQLHEDPDRLRRPLVKRDGVHVEVSWDEAWQAVDDGLRGVIERHGRESLAVYLGNPTAHSLSAMMFSRALLTGLGTRQRYSASTVDQMPRHVAAGYVFGTPVAVPVPDLDRTDFLVVLGANPYASNGSLCTAPDFPGRIEAIQARGGRLVVVDPRRSRTAEQADEWLPIRPGSDALFLAAIANTLFDEGLADPGPHVAQHLAGLDDVRAGLAPFTPEAVEAPTGIAAATIRRLARELAAAPTAAVYGRIGTTTTEFGTTASWLIDVVNVLTGNLDRPGGSMFPLPVAGGPTTRGGPRTGQRLSNRSRALARERPPRGRGGVSRRRARGRDPHSRRGPGPLTRHRRRQPDAVDAERAINSPTRSLTSSSWSASTCTSTRRRSTPTSMLPVPSQLERSHYDMLLLQFAVRNVANYSDAATPTRTGRAGRVGGDRQADVDRAKAWGSTPTCRSSTTTRSPRSCGVSWPIHRQWSTAATPTSSSPPSPSTGDAARSGCST